MSATLGLLETINEGSTATITIDFFDENLQPVIPLLITWRVDDVLTNFNYIQGQTITPSSSSVTIAIPDTFNDIKDPKLEFEYRRLTVVFDVSSSRKGTEEFRWRVRNLRHIP